MKVASSNGRYQLALKLFDAVVNAQQVNGRPFRLSDDVALHANNLFKYLNDNFIHPQQVVDAVEKIAHYNDVILGERIVENNDTSMRYCHEDLKQDPPVIDDVVWPTVVMRSLVTEYRVPLSTIIPEFAKFIFMYRDYILPERD